MIMKKITILGMSCADMIVSSVDKFPKTGSLDLVDSIEMHPGGCATNTAIDLSKIGIPCQIITSLGSDSFGIFLETQLNKYNVNTKYIIKSEDYETSSSIVLLNKNSERSFLHNPGINNYFSKDDINFEGINNADILFIAGSLIMKKFDGKETMETLRIAKENNVYTVLDTAWDPTNQWSKLIYPVLPYLDLFVPSFEEASMISGTTSESEMAKIFKSQGAKDIIIKMGHNGAFANINNEEFYVKPYLIDNPKDTTGAGDSFMAGILTGLYHTWDMKKTIKFANAVGAFCVQSVGASSGIKPMSKILEFMEKRDSK